MPPKQEGSAVAVPVVASSPHKRSGGDDDTAATASVSISPSASSLGASDVDYYDDDADEIERLLPPSSPSSGGGGEIDGDEESDGGGSVSGGRDKRDGDLHAPPPTSPPPTSAAKVGTALFYSVASLGVVFVNKIVLTSRSFPSVLTLAFLQFASTSVALRTCSALGYVRLLPLTFANVRAVLPLSGCYLLNIITGLSSTKNLNLPMMVLLRRGSILLTMMLERYLDGRKHTRTVQLSVGLMLLGALIAALGDLAFHLKGYVIIMFNNTFTALNGVLLKRTGDEYRSDKLSVLYFNSVLSMASTAVIVLCKPNEIGSVLEYDGWSDTTFVVGLITASVMGSVLNYAIFLCTTTNSALTTTVVGCLKNVLTSYLGMVVGGDYIFSWLNFAGVNVSIAGSLMYARATFRK